MDSITKLEWVEPAPDISGGSVKTKRWPAVKISKDNTKFVVGVGDFVHLQSDDENVPYIARIVELIATEEGEKKAKTQWLYRPSETKLRVADFQPNEVFITEHADINPVETILDTVRVSLQNPATGQFLNSKLYGDDPRTDYLTAKPRYISGKFYDYEREQANPLTPAKFKEVWQPPPATSGRSKSPTVPISGGGAVSTITAPKVNEPPKTVTIAVHPAATTLQTNELSKATAIAQHFSSSSSATLEKKAQVSAPVIAAASTVTTAPTLIKAAPVAPNAKNEPVSVTPRVQQVITATRPAAAVAQASNFDILVHSSTCEGGCQIPECRRLNDIRKHSLGCDVPKCIYCQEFQKIISEHARTCKAPLKSCPVPGCEANKPSAVVEHAMVCTRSPCPVPDCHTAKMFLKYVWECKNPTCRPCVKFNDLLALHELSCGTGCVFPSCAHFSATLVHAASFANIPSHNRQTCFSCYAASEIRQRHLETCPAGAHCRFPTSHTTTITTSKSAPPQGSQPGLDSKRMKQTDEATTTTTPMERLKMAHSPAMIRKVIGEAKYERASMSKVMSTTTEEGANTKLSRIGPAFQADLPAYSQVRPVTATAQDTIIWANDNRVGSAALAMEKSRSKREALERRGGVVNVLLSGGPPEGVWVRIVRPLHLNPAAVAEESSSLVRVVPAHLVWPEQAGDPSSFLVRRSAWMIDVDMSAIRFPETVEEAAMYRMYKEALGRSVGPSAKAVMEDTIASVRGCPETLMGWTSTQYDTLTKLPLAKSIVLASKCGKTVAEVNELMLQREDVPLVLYAPLLAGVKCSNCLGSGFDRMVACKRIQACGTCFCTPCANLELLRAEKKDAVVVGGAKANNPSAVGDRRDVSMAKCFMCLACQQGNPPPVPNETPSQAAQVGESYNPDHAWIRHSGVVTTKVTSSSKSSALTKTTTSTIDNGKQFTDNESVFAAYDQHEISAERALDIIRELLISKSRKTLGILANGNAQAD